MTGDIYEVIGCGAEELQTKGGIQPETIDTIITVQCLCSIPTPEIIIKELFPLLKPGGQWLVYEHVKTKHQAEFVGYWQSKLTGGCSEFESVVRLANVVRFVEGINMIWPHFFDGCNITRPTDEWLLQAGEWEEVNLRPGEGEGKYDTLPHAIGTLTKKR